MPLQKQDYALVIGIDDYPNYNRPLKGAIQDAEDFWGWLVDRKTGGGLYKKNCKTLFSSPRPLKPVQDDIDTALDEIRTQARKTGARRFYFYFSGHGQTPTADDVNLCLAKWSEHRFSRTALSSRECWNFVAQCIGFKEIVVLLDCCRVRVVGAAGLPPGVSCVKPVEAAGQTRVFKAYGSEFLNPAYEAEVAATHGDQAAGSIVRGHFTKALLDALKGGAASEGGGVKASTLKKYLEIEVKRIAKKHNHRQKAHVVNGFPSIKEPVFGSAMPEANVKIQFLASRRGEIVLEGPGLEIIKQADASTGPWELTLSKNHYFLRELETGKEMHFRFQPQEEVTHVEF